MKIIKKLFERKVNLLYVVMIAALSCVATYFFSRQLQEKTNENEYITITGRTIYYMLRISILDSALGKGFLDRKLKIVNTARNWRTVQTLAEL